MLEVTDKAIEMIKDYLEKNSMDSPLRVYMSPGGWSGPAFGLALDEPKETDEVYEIKEVTFLIDKAIKKYLKGIKVDYNEEGFRPGFSITPIWSEQDLFTGTCSIWDNPLKNDPGKSIARFHHKEEGMKFGKTLHPLLDFFIQPFEPRHGDFIPRTNVGQVPFPDKAQPYILQ